MGNRQVWTKILVNYFCAFWCIIDIFFSMNYFFEIGFCEEMCRFSFFVLRAGCILDLDEIRVLYLQLDRSQWPYSRIPFIILRRFQIINRCVTFRKPAENKIFAGMIAKARSVALARRWLHYCKLLFNVQKRISLL